MKRTWMLRIAGILCIIAGAVIVVVPIGMLVAAGVAPATPGDDDIAGYVIVILFCIPSIILGTVAIVSGIHALKRRVWGLALAGSIVLVVLSGFGLLRIFSLDLFLVAAIAGIFATTVVIMSKGEFKARALVVDISPKSRRATALLAFFLGVFGAHRFYIRKTITAIVMLLLSIAGWAVILRFVGHGFFVAVWFIIAVGIWASIDFIVAVTGDMTDKEGRLIQKW